MTIENHQTTELLTSELEVAQAEFAQYYPTLATAFKNRDKKMLEQLVHAMHLDAMEISILTELLNKISLLEKEIAEQAYAKKLTNDYQAAKKVTKSTVAALEFTNETASTFSTYISAISHATAHMVEAVVAPIGLALTGIKSLWTLGKAFVGKAVQQRKTKMGAAFVTLGLATLAIVIAAGALAAPIVALPLISLGIVGVGLYKEHYVITQKQKQIRLQENEIIRKDQQLQYAMIEMAKTDIYSNPRVQRLSQELYAQKQQLSRSISEVSALRAKRNLGIASLFGIALLIGGLFFPPLAAAGATVLLGVGVAHIIKERNQKAKQKQLAAVKKSDQQEIQAIINNAYTHACTMKRAPQDTLKNSHRTEQFIFSELAKPLHVDTATEIKVALISSAAENRASKKVVANTPQVDLKKKPNDKELHDDEGEGETGEGLEKEPPHHKL